ncbi:dihydrofolate reductase [Martelella mediterranea]|uniref:Dihydrofolate reductase n=1 Tax=Martelella mediterranea TaxID=293089 RepID=A0A4R3NQN8_9HYPH|nr:dihydrofolate reductase [Martelella mediterranea]TCT37158.1 dihydrofolate reductase [Martelella mediterranea]
MEDNIDVVLMAAVAKNGVIGRDSAMPWHLGSDFKRFKALTMGKPQIMGRKTFSSIGRPLPGRKNIILTRQAGFTIEGCEIAATLDEALAIALADAKEKGVDEIYIQGGGEIYAQAMERADRLRITHVEVSAEGDTRFPDIDEQIWQPVETEYVGVSEVDDYPTRYVVYEKRCS